MKIQDLYPSKWLKGEDLQGRSVTVTIEKLTLERMGQAQETKPVLWFVGARKALVLNRTNALIIARMYGDETNLWAGKAITLQAVQIRAFGESHMVVRVSPTKPNQAKPNQAKPTEPEEAALDDAEDILDDIDDVPFDVRPIQEDDPEIVQPDSAAIIARWDSPIDAQAWAVASRLASVDAARTLWVEAVRRCGGFDRSHAPQVYAVYRELVRQQIRESAFTAA